MSHGKRFSFFAHFSKLSELSRVFSKSCNLIWLICVQVFSGKLNSNKPNFQPSLNFPVTSGRREFPRGFPAKMEHFSDWHPLSCIPILCLCLCTFVLFVLLYFALRWNTFQIDILCPALRFRSNFSSPFQLPLVSFPTLKSKWVRETNCHPPPLLLQSNGQRGAQPRV